VGPTIEDGYFRLCAPVQTALATCGIGRSRPGTADGSFCDGRYNVLVKERKIAGTSQRAESPETVVSYPSYAVILVSADSVDISRRVAEFYETAGAPRVIDDEASTSLRECLGFGER
jgi:octanoyl-[GcvH]:protein N-octanoyltransferase